MSFLDELRSEVPDRNRLLYILAHTVIGAALLGDLALAVVSILPSWRNWQAANLQLQQVHAEMDRVQYWQDARTPEDVVAEIAVAEEERAARIEHFLTEAGATELLDRLYADATACGARVVSLEGLPAPLAPAGEEDPTTPALYEVRAFHLSVRGAVADLLTFVGMVERPGERGPIVSDVVMTEEKDVGRLEMNVAIVVALGNGPAEPSGEPAADGSADLQPDQPPLSVDLGWQEVVAGLDAILSGDPDNEAAKSQLHAAYLAYGNELLAQGESDAARSQFELALEIDPENAEAQAALAATAPTLPATEGSQGLSARLDEAWAIGDWAGAIAALHDLRAADPREALWGDRLYEAYVNHGDRLAADGALTEAKQAFVAALEIRPAGTAAQLGLQDLSQMAPPPAAVTVP